MRPTILAVALVACHGGKQKDVDPPNLLDTGWFTESDSTAVDPANCPDQFVTWSPSDGDAGFYWRDRPTFFTKTPNRPAYQAYLQDENGVHLPTSMEWGTDTNSLSFTLEWDGYLQADTTYEIGLTDCSQFQTITFSTSSLGEPMNDPPSSLSGRTWLLDLAHADWVEPPLLGPLIQQYFTDPILLGVRYADADQIDILGAPGVTDDFGNVSQNLSLSSWDFPLADFSQAPFLDAEADQIELTYDGVSVPVYDFVLQGTFSADGSKLGGAVLSGTGDTRQIGSLLGQPDNLDAICSLAEAAGINCEPCPNDQQPYCLHLRTENLSGDLLPGLELVSDPT